jgi:hypothetical protein
MSTVHDIYDPPPSTTSWLPPEPDAFSFTPGDLRCLLALCAGWVGATIPLWLMEPLVGLLAMIGGALVIFESWYTALIYLHREGISGPWRRFRIILAAHLPWIIGLGIATLLMAGLFVLSDGWQAQRGMS